MEEISKWLSDNSNKFTDLNGLIDSFNHFLSQLSIDEIVNVINITSSLFILACVFSIFVSFSGNYIIDKLELIRKYPKIAKFIQWRVTFNKYYMLLNLLLITLGLFFIIYININQLLF